MTISTVQAGPHVVSVTISNPARRNALTLEMYRDLSAVWAGLASDPQCRAVIVRGEGDEAFCTGSDLTGEPFKFPEVHQLIDAALLKTQFFPKPIVAAVGGDCVGAGLELLLATDVRIASDRSRFGLPEVRWGLMPWGGGAMKLADQIGYAAAMDILLTGRLVGADEALRAGLLSAVTTISELHSLALERARMISEASPIAVQAAKLAAVKHRSAAYQSRESCERNIVAEVRKSGHSKIGIDAFLSKQKPVYPD